MKIRVQAAFILTALLCVVGCGLSVAPDPAKENGAGQLDCLLPCLSHACIQPYSPLAVTTGTGSHHASIVAMFERSRMSFRWFGLVEPFRSGEVITYRPN